MMWIIVECNVNLALIFWCISQVIFIKQNTGVENYFHFYQVSSFILQVYVALPTVGKQLHGYSNSIC